MLAGEQDGITGLAVVAGHGHAGSAAVGGDQPRNRARPDQGLVRQRDHHRAHIHRKLRGRPVLRSFRSFRCFRSFGSFRVGKGAEGGAEGGAHTGAPVFVVDGMNSVQVHLGRAGDDQDGIRAARPQHIDATRSQGLPVQLD